jgi:protein SCO1
VVTQTSGIVKLYIQVKKQSTLSYLLTLFTVVAIMSTSVLAQNMRQPVVSRAPVQQSNYEGGLPKQLKNVGIEQKLNGQLPLDAPFFDADGNAIKLGDCFRGKPVVFAFAYYTCPMLCGQVLQGITGSLEGLSFDVGKEFDVVVVSFNPADSQKATKKSQNTYIKRYARPGTEKGWHFLYGDQASIDRVTKAAGFSYEWDPASRQFAHAAAMMILTPEGKLSKYFMGIEFAPKDVKFALMEATQSKIGTVVDQIMLYCFHYDPNSGKYGPYIVSILRIGAGATIFGLGAFYVAMRKRSSKRRKLDLTAQADAQVIDVRPEQRN